MRVFIDANVLFSAFVFPNGLCDKALTICMNLGQEILVSDYVLDEVRNSLKRKYPMEFFRFDAFLSGADFIWVNSNEVPMSLPTRLRDNKDEPVLRDALAGNADLILTGDKDFLESGLTYPRPIHPAEFINQIKKGAQQ